jgi:hypothetical protein
MELERHTINIVIKFMGNKDITVNQGSQCPTKIETNVEESE